MANKASCSTCIMPLYLILFCKNSFIFFPGSDSPCFIFFSLLSFHSDFGVFTCHIFFILLWLFRNIHNEVQCCGLSFSPSVVDFFWYVGWVFKRCSILPLVLFSVLSMLLSTIMQDCAFGNLVGEMCRNPEDPPAQGRLRGKAEQWTAVGDEVLWPALVQWQNVDSSDVLDFHKAVWTVLEVLVIKKWCMFEKISIFTPT